MFFDNEELDQVMEIADAVFHLPDPSKTPKALFDAKASAIDSILGSVKFYRTQGIRNDLVHNIYSKKMKMLDEATTVSAVRLIAGPPKLHFTGNGFTPGEYCVPEEELIMWSMTSLKGPLIEPAYKRFLELFRDTFGIDPSTADAEGFQGIRVEVF